MTKQENIMRKDEAGNDVLVGIKVTTDKGTFVVPVADVRRSLDQVEQMIKSANIAKGSKYFKPSFSWYGYSYNHSMKRLTPPPVR